MTFPTDEDKKRIEGAKVKLMVMLKTKLDQVFGPIYQKREQDWFISGGVIGSLLRGEQPNDIDIYFRTLGTHNHVVDLLTKSPEMKDKIQDIEEKYRDLRGKDGKCITENAITMKNGLQFITRHTGSPTEIRKSFDFVHCMPWYSVESNKIYISEEQYYCCVNKVLKKSNPDNWTVEREQKFINAGYTLWP